MKLWLHFNRILTQQKSNIEDKIKSENFSQEDVDRRILDSYAVADIQFSKSDQEKYKLLFQIQDQEKLIRKYKSFRLSLDLSFAE